MPLRILKSIVNKSLAPIGIKATRAGTHDWRDTASFIPFESTLEAARTAKLSVGDYVDSIMNGVPGSSQSTIDTMASLGVFSEPLHTIVEIGAGTGRYLEKTLMATRPARYEIYETAGKWATYLVEQYNVTLQRTDGYTLSETRDGCASLVQAHKVFSTVPFMVSCCYFQEIVRVVSPGGWAVFDAMTERCLDADALRIWAKSGIRNGSYPAVIPRAVIVDLFVHSGFSLAASFMVPMPPGTTELFIFKRGCGD